MTFEDYLRAELADGKIDFAFRVVPDAEGIAIYVHPDGRNGNTTPNLVVTGNTLRMSRGSSAPGWTRDDDDDLILCSMCGTMKHIPTGTACARCLSTRLG